MEDALPSRFAFDAVIFDLDGLLLDTEAVALRTGVEAMAALGHPVPEEVLHGMVGVDTDTSFAMICDWLGVALDPVVTKTALGEAFRAGLAEGVPLKTGVHAMLDALDRLDLPRAVATNSATESALWKIGKAGLAGRFDAVVGFDTAGSAKPEPGVYLTAARALGIAPARCLAFEDSDLGVRAARAAGMTVVQIPDFLESREHLAHHEHRSLTEAMAALGL
ncbi:HAD family phosphatase [Frigidibacter sp. MR17.14]|uniref:HAD family hydrolase n=1 Tax=Frigidibacter sp. MR17.14 TaxID=3126509 RepID=UPI003012E0C9